MERYLCIHGHFYQPPRENPWLEAVEVQDSAYPYHDWNEKAAAEWKRRLLSWSHMNKKKKVLVDGSKVPERNEEYLLYQTLLGAWPVGEGAEADYGNFRQRIRDYMIKAVREAKINSSWINPNSMYEEALLIFVDAVTDAGPGNEFLDDFRPFQKMISSCGMFNSLSETLLKIASPGVPDFYQGTELWNFSLVDPYNRRPVDYGKRTRMLDRIKKQEASVRQGLPETLRPAGKPGR